MKKYLSFFYFSGKRMSFILLLICGIFTAKADDLWLSDSTRVFLITATPPTNDYDFFVSFGHSALWFTDPVMQQNEFFECIPEKTPNEGAFFIKHLSNKLYVNTHNFSPESYWESARKEKRKVTVRELNLSLSEMDVLWKDLWAERNKPSEQAYNFIDFNCSSIIRDKLNRIAHISWDNTDQVISMREDTRRYKNKREWEYLILNVLAGTRADEPLSLFEAAYLPEFFGKLTDGSFIKKGESYQPLVIHEETFDYSTPEDIMETPFMQQPVCWIFGLCTIGITLLIVFSSLRKNITLLQVIIYIGCGVLGSTLWLFTFFTENPFGWKNLILLLIHPLQLILGILWCFPKLHKKLDGYFYMQLILIVLFFIFRLFVCQEIPAEVYAIAALLLVSSACEIVCKKFHR